MDEFETATVTVSPPINAVASVTAPIDCFNGTGTVTIDVTAGTPLYTYTFNGVEQFDNGVFTGIPEGTYNWSVEDASSCAVYSGTLKVEGPEILTANVTATNVLCNGSSNGTITVSSPDGGSGTYEVSTGSNWFEVTASSPYVFTGLAPATYSVQIRDAANTGCVIDLGDQIITEPSAILVTASSNSPVCPGNELNLTAVASGGTPEYTYSWSGPDGFNSTEQNPVISNATELASGTYTLLVTDANGCTGTGTTEVFIYPTPTLDEVVFPEYCAGEQTTAITLSGSPSNVAFDISGGTKVGLFLTAADSMAIPKFTTVSGTDTLIIIPRANGCYGEPYKLPITISPTPNIGVSLTKQTICSGAVTDIDYSSFVNNVRYTWSIVSAGADISGYSEATDTLVSGLYQELHNSGTTNETVVYRIYAKNKNCPGPTVDVTITVEPDFSLVVNNPDPDTVCQPNTINLTAPEITAGSTAGLDYEWYNGHPDNPGSTVIANASNISISGTYYIKATNLSSTNYCYKIDSVKVTVAQEPILALNGNETVYKCPLDDYDLQNSIDFGTSNVSDITYWAPDGTELSNTVVGILGEYFIVGVNNAGCTDTVFITIENYSDVETPVFDASSQADVCKGSASSFYTATAVNSTGITYSIEEPANGNTIDPNTGEVTFNPSFSGEIKVIASATGCTANSQGEFIITVHEPPVITAFNATPILICEGEPVYLSATAQGVTSVDVINGSSGTDYAILSRSPAIESPITISETTGATIAPTDKISVTVNITHTYDADLDIYLVDPTGSYVMTLSTDNGGSGNNYTGTIFSTESSNNVTSGTAPFNSTYKPEGDLSDLIGATINGNWKLRIYDDENGDEGTLLDWSLSIEHQDNNGGNFTAVFNDNGTSLGDTLTGTSVSGTIYPLAGTHNYSVTFTDEYGCSATSGTIEVTVQQSPDVEIVADYCAVPGRVQLTAVGGEPGAYYAWTTGDSGYDANVIVVDEVNLYGVTVTNPGGTCSRTVYLKVSKELTINGDFEMGPAGIGTFNTDYVPDNTITGDGYMGEGVYGIGTNARDFYTTFRGAYDHSIGDGTGYFYVVDGTGTDAVVWEQTYTVTPNTNYYFAAWALNIYLDETYGGTMNPHLQFEINGTLFGTDVLLNEWTNDDSNPWLDKFRFYGTWNSGSTTTATVRIRNLISGLQRNDFALDDISFGTLDPLPLTMDLRDTAFCEGETVRAESNSINGLTPTYTWTHLETGNVYYTDTIPYLELTNVSEADEGHYKLDVADGYGCEIIPDTFFIEILDAATVDAGEVGIYCSVDSTITLNGNFGGSANSATWSGEGTFVDPVVSYDEGTGTYSSVTYRFSDSEISNGAATLVLTANPGNTVCAPVTDTLVITIYESPVIDSIVVHSPACNGQANGSAVVYASGGTGPGTYAYLWSNGKTSRILTGVGADTLWVTVTDGNGCEVTDTVMISEPDSLVISARSPIITLPSCYDSNDGMAIIEVTGGIPPYSFIWDEEAALYAHEDTAFNLSAGQYTVLVTDSAGCAAQTFPVEVSQPDPPVLTCPGNYIDSVLPGDCGLILGTRADPTANGYCEYDLYYYLSGDTVASGTGMLTYFEFPIGQTLVKYVIDDGYNRDSCEYMVWIKHVDTPSPDISCATLSPEAAYADADCDADVNVNSLTFTDPCNEIDSVWNNSPYRTSASDASGTYPVGTTEFRWFVLDKSGNKDSSCIVQVTVLDTIKPYITCPGNVEESAAPNNCSKTLATLTDPSYTDACTDVTLTWKMAGATSGSGTGTVTGETFNVGLTTVTYIVNDEAGNKDSCSFTVKIVDVTDPELTINGCSDVEETAADNNCSVIPASITDPVYSDACWPVLDSLRLEWEMTGATTGSGTGSVVGEAFNIGVTTVTYHVYDPDGNEDNCSFDVTILHDEVPQSSFTCPISLHEADVDPATCEANLSLDAPVITDPCNEIDSSWNSSPYRTSASNASGTYPAGSTVFYWYITDVSGNKDSCKVEVIVNDTIPPGLTCPPDISRFADYGENYASGITPDDPVIKDNCDPAELTLSWTMEPPTAFVSEYDPAELSGDGIFSGSGIFYLGVTTITYTLSDTNGNSDECSFTITVEAAPIIDCPPDTTAYADENCVFPFDPGIPTLTQGAQPIDWAWTLTNPDGTTSSGGSQTPTDGANPLPVVSVAPNQYNFKLGTTTIEWTATNDAGSDQCTQTIIVRDTISPVIAQAGTFEFCVDPLRSAVYNGTDELTYNPDYPGADYYTFKAGSTTLDLDITEITDNCCVSGTDDVTIEWTIDFDGSEASVSGTGQPSEYSTDILLWGDGTNFQNRMHTITYWVTDCNGNKSEAATGYITITPRPEIIKMNE